MTMHDRIHDFLMLGQGNFTARPRPRMLSPSRPSNDAPNPAAAPKTDCATPNGFVYGNDDWPAIGAWVVDNFVIIIDHILQHRFSSIVA